MKRILSVILILMYIAPAFGFIDKGEENQEKILRKLDEIKSIQGVLISGRGIIGFDTVSGTGPSFEGMTAVRDSDQLIGMDIEFLTRPADAVTAGVDVRFESDLAAHPTKEPGKLIALRDIFIKARLLDSVEIKLGAIYERFTPFTLYAPLDLAPLRSELFYMYYREDLKDNFLHHKNDFPLQGMSIKVGFFIPAIEADWDVKALLSRLGSSEQEESLAYDRYLIGLNNRITVDKIFRTDLNWVWIIDASETGDTGGIIKPLSSHVFSSAMEIDAAPILFTQKDILKAVGIESEIGMNFFDCNIVDYTNKPITGFAGTVDFFANLLGFSKIKVGWQAVEHEFVSPGAQTRMATPGLSGSLPNFEETEIPPMLFDYSFHNFIRISRDNYNPLNFTYAMNSATPNRTGFFGELSLTPKFIHINSKVSLLEEMRPVAAADNLRSFFRTANEVSFLLPKLIKEKVKLLPEISVIYIIENVKREDSSLTPGNEEEDSQSEILGVEAAFMPVRDLNIIIMYQKYMIQGRKAIDGYPSNEPLDMAGYMIMDFDIGNEVYGAGMIYDFTTSVKFQLDYLYKNYIDNYEIDQARALLLVTF